MTEAQLLRVMSLVVGLLLLGLAVAFMLRLGWATAIWPFAMLETRLGFLFLSSIFAAAALPALWVGLSGDVRAAEAGAFDFALMFGGMAGFLALSYGRDPRTHLVVAAVVCGVLSLVLVGLAFVSRRYPHRDHRPLPRPVRLSFAAFAVVLILVGGALVLGVPNLFPWPLAPESAVMYGWIFLGAAVYFVHGFLLPRWSNAVGQLLGFLIYDLILIGPFLAHFASVRAEHRTSLILYTAVLVYSGVLAAYYLFVHPATRLWGTGEAARVGAGRLDTA